MFKHSVSFTVESESDWVLDEWGCPSLILKGIGNQTFWIPADATIVTTEIVKEYPIGTVVKYIYDLGDPEELSSATGVVVSPGIELDGDILQAVKYTTSKGQEWCDIDHIERLKKV